MKFESLGEVPDMEIRSITDLLEQAGSKRILSAPAPADLGLAEPLPFPFLAVVGQEELKTALLLTVINPNAGGALLIGPRGTGKTTAVRGLPAILPLVDRSRCMYGCLPEDVLAEGMDAVCPDCAKRFGEGESLTKKDQVRLIELPLNARLEDVIGGVDEGAQVRNRFGVKRGILSHADRNLLFVDEANLLQDEIVDAILDAAAQGTFTVTRGQLSATYRSRFVLIGSMNPEEGGLRPQIFDRFGLRVVVKGLEDPEQRMEAYRRTVAYRNNPREVIQQYAELTHQVHEEILAARENLAQVEISPQAEELGLRLIGDLEIDSLRAELTLFEAARAHAVADGRMAAEVSDVVRVAPMSLRLRRSAFMKEYFAVQGEEAEELRTLARKRAQEFELPQP
jgi:magnesium chelatase subunit I